MARSSLDTVVHATILVAPLALALAYIAFTPAPEPVLVHGPGDCAAAVEPAVAVAAPEPPPAAPALVVAPAPAPASVAGAGVLLFDDRLALSVEPDLTWSKGQLRVHPNDYGVTVSKSVDMTRLPAELVALAGRRFMVYGADGSACATDAGAMSIYARVDGSVAPWDDPELDEAEAARALREARSDTWEHHAHFLLARTGAPRCRGLWARRADLPAAAVYGRRKLDESAHDALAAEIADELDDHPRVLGLRAEYTEWYLDIDAEFRAEHPAWTSFYRDSLVVQRWDEIGGARSYYTVDVGSPGESCSGEFFGHVSFVLSPAADPQPGHAWDILEGEGFWRPEAVMDLDRDGRLEAVTAGGTHLETMGSDPALAQSYEIPWYGCPC
ncbi:MAG: hypothetical protein JNL82_38915 [Myxococcales bacterium]|nr:hypothetical protein [Myxococcales bacterium]